MVSYWKTENEGVQPTPFYDEDGELFLIYGYYDHMNKSGGTCAQNKCIGIYWRDDFPSSHGYLTPCVIPEQTAMALLNGLLAQLLAKGEKDRAEKVGEAIRFMKGKTE